MNGRRFDKPITLCIETTLAGGSLAICCEDKAFAETGPVSRSESLLPAIDILLQRALLDIRDVTSIAVSRGPGSFTGIRIGVATALGFKASLGAPCVGISSTEAVASTSPDVDRYAVVPVGRGQYATQYFEAGETEASVPSQFYDVSEDDLFQMIIGRAQSMFVFAWEINIADFDGPTNLTTMQNAIVSEKPTAELMGDLVMNGYRRSDLTPIYARPEGNPSR